MNSAEDRYEELQDAINTIDTQLAVTTDRTIKDILEDCKDRLQEEFDEIKDDTESIWENEKKVLENEYWRSVI